MARSTFAIEFKTATDGVRSTIVWHLLRASWSASVVSSKPVVSSTPSNRASTGTLNASHHVEDAGSDSVAACLVFLELLVAHAELGCEVLERQAMLAPKLADVWADYKVSLKGFAAASHT
jgi:hypothetical protein